MTDARSFNGDVDPRQFGPSPDDADRHQPEWDCDCHCPTCHAPLEESPYASTVFARCGDCHGGEEPDGEAFRGGEAAAYEREQQAYIQRVLK